MSEFIRLINLYNRDLENGVITMSDYKIFMNRVDKIMLGRDLDAGEKSQKISKKNFPKNPKQEQMMDKSGTNKNRE